VSLIGRPTELGPTHDVLAIQRESISSARIRGFRYSLVGPDKTVLDTWTVAADADAQEYNETMLAIIQTAYRFLQKDVTDA